METWISIERSSFTQSFSTPDSFSKSMNPHVLVEFQSRNVTRGNTPVRETSSCGEKIVKLYNEKKQDVLCAMPNKHQVGTFQMYNRPIAIDLKTNSCITVWITNELVFSRGND